ncbi:PhzF family phenazine biosynthesis protein [Vallitalea okinawensis]|uniref:PhzF family phenazine biosynthesis protein n=1 Tax=Vallitalea okinawensis TaxID=2078660 RepID=UPI000CFAB08B|nr:PhzF family phenazine biosynthesis protein [Vallitalea okinawensis]
MSEIFRLRSFTKNNRGGNPAGVVLNADHLNDDAMRKIASEVGYSETAFVMDSNKADFRVRFFTPVEEVDLCGHATIATFSLLRERGIIGQGCYQQETKAGILKIVIDEHHLVYMEQKKPQFLETLNKNELLSCFDLNDELIDNDLPIQVVSTGIRDIFLPIRDLHLLTNMQPHYNNISQLSRQYNVTGIHAFTLETKEEASAHCRNFAPLYGIDEESATGTSNGALACYLSKYKDKFLVKDYVFEQGYSMGQPSEIRVRLKLHEDNISEVVVGGCASIL